MEPTDWPTNSKDVGGADNALHSELRQTPANQAALREEQIRKPCHPTVSQIIPALPRPHHDCSGSSPPW